ncbi:MAG TPA: glycosyltransferase family 2 protein [Blastocatellia bacterium]|nr:glycosyltransferase family 2 protein [Blastocatellia bacterium]HMV87878.1 glycosyltransferase family 2 protein [Blastocatellia bacterium]HMX29142.1 glycosyltransferase family 2 protein [Blastocatellia bacterium]HMY72811.1 glycosyltransferase family 2 protein [Blastocatellia bacterium]HMZ20181.1 glycosyltransferase family 2 protein [Blastocatellia bacterium]
MKISAKINVYNEEANIAAVCESVAWADEIVVCDSNSTDRTVEIARRYTDKIFNHEFRGYKDKHEYSDSMTTGDWILWMDADERVTSELRAAIEALKQRDPATLPDGFRIARRTEFLGRWILHSGWYPDYQMRLYRKAASYWDGVAPHEVAHVRGRVEILPGELLHYTSHSLSDHHRRTDTYATLAADYLHRKGKRARGIDLFILPIAAFIRTYLLKQGFRDGVPGLAVAMFTAYGVFLKYAKLWERRHVKTNADKD